VKKVKDNVFRPTHTNFGSVFTFVKLTKKPDTEVQAKRQPEGMPQSKKQDAVNILLFMLLK